MKDFRVYRPNKNVSGGAIKINPKETLVDKYVKWDLMFEYAPQIGIDENENASFAWGEKDKAIVMKLGEIDIGEILSLISGRKNSIELFHKNPRHPDGSTVLKAEKHEKGFYFNVSRKLDKESPLVKGSISLTFGDGEILRVLINSFVSLSYDW